MGRVTLNNKKNNPLAQAGVEGEKPAPPKAGAEAASGAPLEDAKASAHNGNSEQIVEILQTLAGNISSIAAQVNTINGRLDKVEAGTSVAPTTTASSTDPILNAIPRSPAAPALPQFQLNSDAAFLTAVPATLLSEAKRILGDKFDFKCEPSGELPQFTFTIIVPPEYSPMKGKMPDLRSRVIPNVEGINGVREWCERVKSKIIKELGATMPIRTA